MNILHVKYAVEVAKTCSINKAAETLWIAQPNLSRSIKCLEDDLGITIFNRSAKGMTLTPEGKVFVEHARYVLEQIDNLESTYKGGMPVSRRFSISVPRASYIAHAFANFSKRITCDPTLIYYKETNSSDAINNILDSDYRLGIIRYAEGYENYFNELLRRKNLVRESVAEFSYVLLMHEESPLAALPEIRFSDLAPLIQITHADPYVPFLSQTEVVSAELPGSRDRKIYVFERSSQFELLNRNPQTFMWVSPVPNDVLERYSLVQKPCADNKKICKDVLVRRKDYVLTDLDKDFIVELCNSRRAILGRMS